MKLFSNVFNNFVKSKARKDMLDLLNKTVKFELTNNQTQNNPKIDKKYMLYINIPFCDANCKYCTCHKIKHIQNAYSQYCENLKLELKRVKNLGFNFDTLYIGGGTTVINTDELLKIIDFVKNNFNIKFISLESEPNYIEPEKMENFKGLVNRLSLNIQSFNDEILKKLDRFEKFGSREILFEKITKIKGIFPILSLDMTFNFPFQSQEQLLQDIQDVKFLNCEQVSYYPFMKSWEKAENIAKNLNITYKNNEENFYYIIKDNFADYHMSNCWTFSKDKLALSDEYVAKNHEYIGVGSGAYSFLDGRLFINAFDLETYNQRLKANLSPIVSSCYFNNQNKLRYIFLSELFSGSVNIAKFNIQNSVNIFKDLKEIIHILKLSKAIQINKDNIKVTKFGSYLVVLLLKDFYVYMNQIRNNFKNSQNKIAV